jgi:hypothetical protein
MPTAVVASIPVVATVAAPVPVVIVVVAAIPAAVPTMAVAVAVAATMPVAMTPVTGPFGGVETVRRFQRDGRREGGDRECGDRCKSECGGHRDPGESAPGAVVRVIVSAHRNYLVRYGRRAGTARPW